jgi:hypothetical protein
VALAAAGGGVRQGGPLQVPCHARTIFSAERIRGRWSVRKPLVLEVGSWERGIARDVPCAERAPARTLYYAGLAGARLGGCGGQPPASLNGANRSYC